MIRPVWHSPIRGETDSSDLLQSDVMRFMAILAFCLVAIFALVQSLPLQPVDVKPPETVAREQPPQAPSVPPRVIHKPEPVLESMETQEPEPQGESLQPVPERQPPPPPRPAPEPVASPAETRPSIPETAAREEPEPEPEPESQEGFLLRFATDTALLALVAQRRVEVFGWSDDQAWRLSSQRGMLEFSPAAKPRQFHAMAASTVPASIVLALNEAVADPVAPPLTWGVTLPPDMSRQLQRLLRENEGGTLLIHADGRVRLGGNG